MTTNEYSEVLLTASNALSLIAKDVKVVGDDSGRFLFATLGDFGIEFYAGGDRFVVDPSIHEELQGERTFQTADEALSFAKAWLSHTY